MFNKPHLFETDFFCKIIKYFIVTFDLFNVSFLKNVISLYIFYLTDYTLLDAGAPINIITNILLQAFFFFWMAVNGKRYFCS